MKIEQKQQFSFDFRTRRGSDLSGRAFEEVWKAVEGNRPVLVGMTISAAFFMPGAGGVIDSDEPEDAALRHAVVVVATGMKAKKRLLLAQQLGRYLGVARLRLAG